MKSSFYSDRKELAITVPSIALESGFATEQDDADGKCFNIYYAAKIFSSLYKKGYLIHLTYSRPAEYVT